MKKIPIKGRSNSSRARPTHADRAAPLVDGRLQRIWQPEELARLRSMNQPFDAALAAGVSAGA